MRGAAVHLGHDKFFYAIDIKWIFNFYKHLDTRIDAIFCVYPGV
jgi:hypothetical protein